MTGRIILGSVFVFCLVLLLIPIRFCFSYFEQPLLTIWIAFVPLKILPPETGGKRSKPEKQQNLKGEKKEKQSLFSEIREGKGLGEFLSFLKKLLHILLRAVKRVGRHLIAERCEAEIAVGGEDSASVAEQYGRICSAVFPVWAQLLSLTRCRRHNLQIYPDFFSKEYQIRCKIRIRLRLGWVICAAVAACVSFLRLMLKEKMDAAGRSDGNTAKKNTTEQTDR